MVLEGDLNHMFASAQYDGRNCPAGVALARGATLTWFSDESVAGDGWEICGGGVTAAQACPRSCVTGCGLGYDNCASNPCNNGGICTSLAGSFTCECPNRICGETCDERLDPTLERCPVSQPHFHPTCDEHTCMFLRNAYNE